MSPLKAALEPLAGEMGDHPKCSLEDAAILSAAISLKRIADALREGSPFLQGLQGVLDDASHNHQQRMRNL